MYPRLAQVGKDSETCRADKKRLAATAPLIITSRTAVKI